MTSVLLNLLLICITFIQGLCAIGGASSDAFDLVSSLSSVLTGGLAVNRDGRLAFVTAAAAAAFKENQKDIISILMI